MSRYDDDGDAPVSLGEAKVVRETDKALLVRDSDDEEFWIPKSCVHDDSEVYSTKNGEGKLVVKQWWAVKNGRA